MNLFTICLLPADEVTRNKIIELYGSQRHSLRQIAAAVGLSRQTVSKYIRRYEDSGRVYVLKPPGRPEKLNQQQADSLRNAAIANPFQSHSDLVANINGIPTRDTKTVTRNLKNYGIQSRIAAQKTYLGPTENRQRNQDGDFPPKFRSSRP